MISPKEEGEVQQSSVHELRFEKDSYRDEKGKKERKERAKFTREAQRTRRIVLGGYETIAH